MTDIDATDRFINERKAMNRDLPSGQLSDSQLDQAVGGDTATGQASGKRQQMPIGIAGGSTIYEDTLSLLYSAMGV